MGPNDFTNPEARQKGIIRQDEMKNVDAEPSERKIEPKEPKVDMEGIFEAAGKQRSELRDKMKSAMDKSRPEEDAVSKLNQQLSGGKGSDAIEKELEDMDKFSEDDLALAEELLFNGFCRKDIPLTKKTKATFYSMNADEMEMINQLMFEFTKKHENKDGIVDVSQKSVDSLNALYVLAVSFRGFDGKDIAPSKSCSLEMLKSAFKQLAELEISGDIETHGKLSEEIKKVMKIRATYVRRKPTALIDVLTSKRYEFERVLYDILKRGDVYPK